LTVTLPQINERQTHRTNITSSSQEQYCRKSIYIPMLDSFILDMETRFSTQDFSITSPNLIATLKLLKYRSSTLDKDDLQCLLVR